MAKIYDYDDDEPPRRRRRVEIEKCRCGNSVSLHRIRSGFIMCAACAIEEEELDEDDYSWYAGR